MADQLLPGVLQSGAYERLSFGPFKRTGAIAETYPRVVGNQNSSVLASGRLSLVGIELLAGEVITSITFCAATQALVAGTAQWFGLFDLNRLMLRLTADDTSAAWAANAEKTLVLTTTFTATYTGPHYLGINVVGGTVPTLAGLPTTNSAAPTRAPAVAGNSDTGLTNPASCPATAAAFAAIGAVPWAYCS